ncbi:BMP family ABC transporter substrate-binding protein [Clostridium botulinum]|uniref:BMP family ABC transporter substrate-binding protein n=1 Tax=Clostridium botulinum TaxID=1491 RepID=A0A6B4JQV1_CLOBO|nr:BMP family ABC transporter substrate-binding protein [Clostridium botulinum]EES47734.1 putative membrane protein [Clostridium botulinum E1 str. 'BoNT E Beluga']MBY6762636.1 BMP family ABC transporter substrate-binding protein [Clostridium botulinum]MBY6921421.1 BMP family ABC transporter substrate-binding protein [Clostridium botulinum]MCR1132347.1 BMP family ABC transporter substrate-binding protein [Clostridium botulinum]NFH70702.1 BMP family ABC transporter substrate-binding protein [Clo
MKRRLGKLSSIILIIALFLGTISGCSKEGKDISSNIKVAVVCDSAGKNDNGYNQSAVKGAEKVAEQLGCEYKIVEPTNGVPSALETLASDGYNVIFSLEYDFDALIKGVGGAKPIAEMYPDTTFVVFNDNPNKNDDGTPIHKNVISVLFDVHEASYIAGSLSVQVLENADILFGKDNYNFTPLDDGGRSIGFIGGTNSNGITVFSYGFVQGINHAAEELNVNYNYYSKYDAGFADPSLGSTVAGTFYNQGANLVYSVAGSVGDGAASKAKEQGKLAIHVDANKDAQQPGYILTSVVKNTEVPVFDITKACVDGNISSMDNFQTFSLDSGATSITDLSEISKRIQDTEEAKAKWAEINDYIDKLGKQIADGEIKVVNAAIGEEFDTTTCKNVLIK